MKNSLLIPNKYKVLGWILFLAFAVLGLFCMYADFKIPSFDLSIFNIKEDNSFTGGDYNLTNELAFLGVTVGLLMIVFAKEKIEDEYIALLRLKSLQRAVLISYIILLILNFTAYGLSFSILLIYNSWTFLIIFILKFYWNLYQLKKEGNQGEK